MSYATRSTQAPTIDEQRESRLRDHQHHHGSDGATMRR